jgi:Leucine-rich repeat (LRR) protein
MVYRFLIPILRYPNIEEVKVERSKIDDLNNPIENCQNIKRLSLELNGVTEISNNLFNNCQKLEKIEIKSNSLEDLPDSIFQNLPNLKELELEGKKLKIRKSLFEGLKKLSILKLFSIDLNQVKPSFFKSLKIKSLTFSGQPFPIQSINSHETLEELWIQNTNVG